MEIRWIIEKCLIAAKSLEEWAQPQKFTLPDWQKSWNPTVYPTPKGPVLIIACVSVQSLVHAVSQRF